MQIIRSAPETTSAPKAKEPKHVALKAPKNVAGFVSDDGKYYHAEDGVVRVPEEMAEELKKDHGFEDHATDPITGAAPPVAE